MIYKYDGKYIYEINITYKKKLPPRRRTGRQCWKEAILLKGEWQAYIKLSILEIVVRLYATGEAVALSAVTTYIKVKAPLFTSKVVHTNFANHSATT